MAGNYEHDIVADEATLREFAEYQADKRAKEAARAERLAPVDYSSPDPRDVAHTNAQRVIEKGGTEEAALAMSFATIVEAAKKGDVRVRLDLQGHPNTF